MSDFPKSWSEMNVALCHDWLTGMRGGERVLEVLCEGFPRAEINTLIYNRKALSETINSHKVNTSWLQHIPGISRNYRMYLPFFPSAIQHMTAPQADLIISTSHCAAKGIRSRPGAKHLCYCFTPMRYAWTFYEEYFGNNPVKSAMIKPVLAALRAWDRKTSNRVTRFVAISKHVQARIKKFYDRDSDVVYPPVDTLRCTPGASDHAGFDLIVSALVPYKRIDLAVNAYTKLGFPLKIVGVGSELNSLAGMAGPNVEFIGWQSDDAVLDLYRSCRYLVFPGEEDFGIVPVEAQACGRPVIAYGKGGARETVVADISGVFFETQSEDALIAAVEKAESTSWNIQLIRANAEKFSTQVFIDGMAASIAKTMNQHRASIADAE